MRRVNLDGGVLRVGQGLHIVARHEEEEQDPLHDEEEDEDCNKATKGVTGGLGGAREHGVLKAVREVDKVAPAGCKDQAGEEGDCKCNKTAIWRVLALELDSELLGGSDTGREVSVAAVGVGCPGHVPPIPVVLHVVSNIGRCAKDVEWGVDGLDLERALRSSGILLPDIVLGLNLDPVSVDQEVEVREVGGAGGVCMAVANLIFDASGGKELLSERLEPEDRHEDAWGSCVEDGINTAVDLGALLHHVICVSFVGISAKSDTLVTGRPEVVVEDVESD